MRTDSNTSPSEGAESPDFEELVRQISVGNDSSILDPAT